jgi:hypothetical protein
MKNRAILDDLNILRAMAKSRPGTSGFSRSELAAIKRAVAILESQVVAKKVTKHEVLEWLKDGIFSIVDGQVYSSSGRQLVQRINKRRGCQHGDPRVDLKYDGKRRSIHVSHLVWMWGTKSVIPDKFEIHHWDEDPTNNDFSNLIAVHPIDHVKLHACEEVPF